MSTHPPRLLFVHAHPDDETLATGLSMAHYGLAGAEVHLLTCTLGEEGEVIPDGLQHLAAADGDRLGAYREQELSRAMSHLGVSWQVLGAPDRRGGSASRSYRDSGMAGSAAARHPRALAAAPVAQVAADLTQVLERIQPDVVVSYDEHGGYGHPDHIATHRAVVAALARARAPRPRLFAVVIPHTWAVADRAWVADQVPDSAGLHRPDAQEPWAAGVVEDSVVSHVVLPSPAAVRLRNAALAEHATQVSLFDGYYALSNRVAARLPTREAFVELDPTAGGRVADAPRRATGCTAAVVDRPDDEHGLGPGVRSGLLGVGDRDQGSPRWP